MSLDTHFFTSSLMTWHRMHNVRELPWKGERNPYKIWLSEIILQQTRAEQGLDYYLKFIKLFPTVQHLANASLEEVIYAWEGLGYYSRARNLHFSAKYITEHLEGKFPESYDEIIKLKGVGPYTAAAISSFAYNEKRAVVDGNVIRVLSRFMNHDTPYDTSKGKNEFQNLADEVLFEEDPASYNQAIMDFGASVCKPKLPNCPECVLIEHCLGFNQNKVKELPVKSKKLKIKERNFLFFVINFNGATSIEERQEKDIWQSLNQFPLIEVDAWEDETIKAKFEEHFKTAVSNVINVSDEYAQRLTHQKIRAKFVTIETTTEIKGFRKIGVEKLSNFAFPKIINLFLERNSVILRKD